MKFNNFSEFWKTKRQTIVSRFSAAEALAIHEVALDAWDAAVNGPESEPVAPADGEECLHMILDGFGVCDKCGERFGD